MKATSFKTRHTQSCKPIKLTLLFSHWKRRAQLVLGSSPALSVRLSVQDESRDVARSTPRADEGQYNVLIYIIYQYIKYGFEIALSEYLNVTIAST